MLWCSKSESSLVDHLRVKSGGQGASALSTLLAHHQGPCRGFWEVGGGWDEGGFVNCFTSDLLASGGGGCYELCLCVSWGHLHFKRSSTASHTRQQVYITKLWHLNYFSVHGAIMCDFKVFMFWKDVCRKNLL